MIKNVSMSFGSPPHRSSCHVHGCSPNSNNTIKRGTARRHFRRTKHYNIMYHWFARIGYCAVRVHHHGIFPVLKSRSRGSFYSCNDNVISCISPRGRYNERNPSEEIRRDRPVLSEVAEGDFWHRRLSNTCAWYMYVCFPWWFPLLLCDMHAGKKKKNISCKYCENVIILHRLPPDRVQ